jgi:molybdopterin-guanine dinucleotide biosynthesis adapter protein
MARRPPVISFVGRSNSGKTTFLEKLIPVLKELGVRVATIKHDVHDFEIDREGKDTYRHKKAGARITMIASPKKLALVEDLDSELPLETIVTRYVRNIDLVMTEGYKKEQMPKIEVYAFREDVPPLALDDPNVLAIVADVPLDAHVPVFSRDNPAPVADFIIEKFGLKTGQGS